MFRALRREKKELPREECIKIITEAKRGVLSVLGDDDYPYGMPINHLYNEEDGCLYFHCGVEDGHRNDSIKKHNKVSYCVMDEGYTLEGQWAERFKSVIVFGKIEMIDDMKVIEDIARKICYKFTDDENFITMEIKHSAHRTLILKLEPEHICGKFVIEA